MTYQRIISLLIVCGCFFASAMADVKTSYTVIDLNSKGIRYLNDTCKQGTVITSVKDIHWTSEDQAMVVRDNVGRQIVFTPRQVVDKKTGKTNYVTRIPLSRRAGWDSKDLADMLTDVRIFDEWHGYTTIRTPDPGRYVLTYDSDEGTKGLELKKPSDFEFVITREMFGDDVNRTIKAKFERIAPTGEVQLICDNVNIRFLKGIK